MATFIEMWATLLLNIAIRREERARRDDALVGDRLLAALREAWTWRT